MKQRLAWIQPLMVKHAHNSMSLYGLILGFAQFIATVSGAITKRHKLISCYPSKLVVIILSLIWLDMRHSFLHSELCNTVCHLLLKNRGEYVWSRGLYVRSLIYIMDKWRPRVYRKQTSISKLHRSSVASESSAVCLTHQVVLYIISIRKRTVARM